MIKGLQSILMYVCVPPISHICFCLFIFQNGVSLLSFRYRQMSCYFIRPRPSLLDDDDCACSPFILDTMAVWLACRSTHQICHVISTLSVGRRRPHRIWFNRPGELPPHHILYILTFVVFGVSMVGCMVARDVHYVDGTLMHRLMGVNYDKLASSWILRRVSCSTPALGYDCIRKEICYQKYI